ncbi:MAG: hypothetical protein RIE08_03660 [Acidimicrobiales bacterium]
MAERSQRTQYAPLVSGLIGVAVGAAIGAGTGMWWMMGVLGGTFAGLPPLFTRNRRRAASGTAAR